MPNEQQNEGGRSVLEFAEPSHRHEANDRCQQADFEHGSYHQLLGGLSPSLHLGELSLHEAFTDWLTRSPNDQSGPPAPGGEGAGDAKLHDEQRDAQDDVQSAAVKEADAVHLAEQRSLPGVLPGAG